MNYVIGSGPAGISAAVALLSRGKQVTLLDGGEALEQPTQDILRKMRLTPKENWALNDLSVLKGESRPTVKGLPVKYSYGSDFPFRESGDLIKYRGEGVEIYSSMARGGMSSVWGAAILPYSEKELNGWPVTVSELAPHYQSLFSFLPLSAEKDDLEKFLPLFSTPTQSLKLSKQAEAFLTDLQQSRSSLNKQGIHFGKARLAVHVKNRKTELGCVYCGMCLYGCPYSLIYNSEETLNELIQNPKFTYVPNVVVTRFEEKGREVEITGYFKEGQKPFSFKAERLFVGAGILPTANLVLNSLGKCDTQLTFKTSQHFLIPWLRYKKTPRVSKEELSTLSQLFVEVFDSTISEYPMHLQVYSYNDMYGPALKDTFKFAYDSLKSTLDENLLGRMLLIQGYLHSDLSGSLSLKLRKENGKNAMQLDAALNPKTKVAVKKLSKLLLKNAKYFKAMPALPMIKISPAGGGAHSGGTFPMKLNPTELQTNKLGVLTGLSKVHLIDASVFPTIPASTITLTIMANAHRIASEA